MIWNIKDFTSLNFRSNKNVYIFLILYFLIILIKTVEILSAHPYVEDVWVWSTSFNKKNLLILHVTKLIYIHHFTSIIFHDVRLFFFSICAHYSHAIRDTPTYLHIGSHPYIRLPHANTMSVPYRDTASQHDLQISCALPIVSCVIIDSNTMLKSRPHISRWGQHMSLADIF